MGMFIFNNDYKLGLAILVLLRIFAAYFEEVAL